MKTVMEKAIRDHFALVAILCSALLIRLYELSQGGLWYDELQSVTFAGLSVVNILKSITIVSPFLVDPHPPLYYLQLHFWMKIGQSDWFALLNSVLWSLLTIVSIYFTVKKIYAKNIALWASFLFAVLPYSVSYAQEARMYSMMMMLAVWIWYFNYQFLLKSSRNHALAGLFVTTILFLYSHSSAFVILPAVYSFFLISILQYDIAATVRNKWIAAQVLLVALYGFWLVKAYKIKYAAAQASVNFDAVLESLWNLCFGFAPFEQQWLKLALLTIMVGALVSVMIKAKEYFSFIFSFVVVPIAVCLVVSVLFAPLIGYKSLYCVLPP